MRSRSVSCRLTRVNVPRLTPARHAGSLVMWICLHRRQKFPRVWLQS